MSHWTIYFLTFLALLVPSDFTGYHGSQVEKFAVCKCQDVFPELQLPVQCHVRLFFPRYISLVYFCHLFSHSVNFMKFLAIGTAFKYFQTWRFHSLSFFPCHSWRYWQNFVLTFKIGAPYGWLAVTALAPPPCSALRQGWAFEVNSRWGVGRGDETLQGQAWSEKTKDTKLGI